MGDGKAGKLEAGQGNKDRDRSTSASERPIRVNWTVDDGTGSHLTSSERRPQFGGGLGQAEGVLNPSEIPDILGTEWTSRDDLGQYNDWMPSRRAVVDRGRVELWHSKSDSIDHDDDAALQKALMLSLQEQGSRPRVKEKGIVIAGSRNVERGSQSKPPESAKGKGKNIVYEQDSDSD